jgi:demethylmenaquinone methyltransferase/2-methoxy-6-polyprenyl-1,4-benzoquinol methylase
MKEYYAARAKEYDQIYAKPERQADLRLIEQWLPPRFVGARVLEIAAGTGYWSQFIAPIATSLLGIDASAETLQIAQARPNNKHAQWLVGDAYALPAPHEPFDAAFAGFWFSHVPLARQQEFLLGLNKTLQSGARVVMLDNLYVEGNSTPLTTPDSEGDTYQIRKLADGSSHRVLKNYPKEFDLCELVASFGEQPTYTTWQYYWAFEYVLR